MRQMIYNLVMETIRTIMLKNWSRLVKMETLKYSVTFA